MMDTNLLGNAVEYHGPMLIRHLKDNDQIPTETVLCRLRGFDPRDLQSRDPELASRVQKFVARKADLLFRSVEEKEENWTDQEGAEDLFAKLPPLETFMGIPPEVCKKHFYNSLEKRDVVIGVVSTVLESGLVLTLLCLDNGRARDIDELKISAFCPAKELPRLFPHQSAVEGFQVKDYIRGVVLSVNPETERIIVSLLAKSLPEDMSRPKMGLITDEDFPVHYRRKLGICDLTFGELLHSVVGFQNVGNIKALLEVLNQEENSSFMEGLNNLEILQKDFPENLRKYQNQKLAHKRVADGIALFKSGKHLEALQLLNKTLQIDTLNVEAMVARGALYANNESFSQAIKDFKDALKVNAQHSNARSYLYETLLAQGRRHEDNEKFEAAEDYYREAMTVKLDSQDAKEALRKLSLIKSRRNIPEGRYKPKPNIVINREEYRQSPHHMNTPHGESEDTHLTPEEMDADITKSKRQRDNKNKEIDDPQRHRRRSSTERMAETLKQLIAEDEKSRKSDTDRDQYKRRQRSPDQSNKSRNNMRNDLHDSANYPGGVDGQQQKFYGEREKETSLTENREIRTISVSNKGQSNLDMRSSPASWHMSGDGHREKDRISKNQIEQCIKRNDMSDSEQGYFNEYRSITIAPANSEHDTVTGSKKQNVELSQKIISYKSPQGVSNRGRIDDDQRSSSSRHSEYEQQMRSKQLNALSDRNSSAYRGSDEIKTEIWSDKNETQQKFEKLGSENRDVIDTTNISKLFMPRKVDKRYQTSSKNATEQNIESSEFYPDSEHEIAYKSRRCSLPDTSRHHSREHKVVEKIGRRYPSSVEKYRSEKYRRSRSSRSHSREHRYHRTHSRSRSRSHEKYSGFSPRSGRNSFQAGGRKKVEHHYRSPKRLIKDRSSLHRRSDSHSSYSDRRHSSSQSEARRDGRHNQNSDPKYTTDFKGKTEIVEKTMKDDPDPTKKFKKMGLTIADFIPDKCKWDSPDDGDKSKKVRKSRWDTKQLSPSVMKSELFRDLVINKTLDKTDSDTKEATTPENKDVDIDVTETENSEVAEKTPEIEQVPFWLFDKEAPDADMEVTKITSEEQSKRKEGMKIKDIDTEKFVFKKHRHSDTGTEYTEYNFLKVKATAKGEKEQLTTQERELKKTSDEAIEKMSQTVLKIETDKKHKIDKRNSSPQQLGFFGLMPTDKKGEAETLASTSSNPLSATEVPSKELAKQISLVEYGSPGSPADSNLSDEVIKHVDSYHETEREKIFECSSSAEKEKHKKRRKSSKSRMKRKKRKIVSLDYISDSGSSEDSYNTDSSFSPQSSPYSSTSEKQPTPATPTKGKSRETLSGLETFLSDLKAKKKQQWIQEGKLKPDEN